jgi:hypothetical protein
LLLVLVRGDVPMSTPRLESIVDLLDLSAVRRGYRGAALAAASVCCCCCCSSCEHEFD